jgi:predicted MFS family arabinose efflux permease
LSAVLIAAMVMPSALAVPAKAPSRRLLDFRPVLRNRAVIGWIVGYTVHTWGLSALRAWGVTFLAAVCASQGAPSWLPDPAVLFTIAGLAGIAVSITGNETAQRWGRARVVTVAMGTAAVLSLLTGWSATAPAVVAAALVVLWNAATARLDRRHRAGRRQGVARRHHGVAQHVRLCRRLYRPARRRADARLDR